MVRIIDDFFSSEQWSSADERKIVVRRLRRVKRRCFLNHAHLLTRNCKKTGRYFHGVQVSVLALHRLLRNELLDSLISTS